MWMTAAVLLGPTAAGAAIIDTFEVGSGLYTSSVQIDFASGNGYTFNVHWQDASTTGWDLLLAISADLDLVELDYSTSEFGVFLQGIEVMGDSDWGIGPGGPRSRTTGTIGRLSREKTTGHSPWWGLI